MSDKFYFTRIGLVCLLLSGIFISAQDADDSRRAFSGRWRLKFELIDTPKTIAVEDPAGQSEVYWYFRYKIINDSDRNIKWRGDIRVVIDKSRPEIPDHRVPGLFHQGELPEEKGGINYRILLATRGAQPQFWEIILHQDAETKLSVLQKRKVNSSVDVGSYDITAPYLGHYLDEEIQQKVEFIEKNMQGDPAIDSEIDEINRLARQAMPLIDPEYKSQNFDRILKAARQVGLKEFNYPEVYLSRLQTYYDVDLPVVRTEIFKALGIYPRLTGAETAILGNLTPPEGMNEWKKSVFEMLGTYYALVWETKGDEALEVILHENLQGELAVSRQCSVRLPEYRTLAGFVPKSIRDGSIEAKSMEASRLVGGENRVLLKASVMELSYEEAESALVNLVVRQLVLPEETPERPILASVSADGAKFMRKDADGNEQEIVFAAGEAQNSIAGWDLVACLEGVAVMKKETPKGSVITGFYAGACLDYLYSRTFRAYEEKDKNYASGMTAQGIYRGRVGENGEGYDFENVLIPPRQEYIFTSEDKHSRDLSKMRLPEDLRSLLQSKGLPLSENATVGVDEWEITDKQGKPCFSVLRDRNDLRVYEHGRHLFDMDLGQQVALNQGEMGQLQEAFAANGSKLGDDLRVKEVKQWQIDDGENLYLAAKDRHLLHVYRRNDDYIHYGLAIFPDISPEMDTMGIAVPGLVDPIVDRQYHISTPAGVEVQRRTYVENEIFLSVFERPGDEFTNADRQTQFLYAKRVILSRRQIRIQTRVEGSH